ncbi:hypothetical protein [Yoonia sp. 208BN28-4]|uniref:hypothetical protein n=1 Tax=Yoonia sp. 208BN28-4 TaxID=3126505 RepID=UPI0030AD240B
MAEFAPLTGDEIRETLTDADIIYPMAAQTFFASGRTLYETDAPEAWGYWRVEQGQYCSQWPPSDLWACYDVSRDGDKIRFTAGDGFVTDGVLQD